MIPLVHIYLTEKCNMNCPYCNRKYSEKHMDVDKFKDIIKMLKNDVYSFVIFGYEPSLHPNIDEIIHFLNNENVRYSISTNGTNLDKLIDYGAKMINLTVEGFKREHLPDCISWKKTQLGIEGLKKLKDYGVEGVVGVTVTSLNLHIIPEIVKFVDKFEHRCCPCPVMVNKKGRLVSLNYTPYYALNEHDKGLIAKVIKELSELYNDGYKIDPPQVFEKWIPHAWKQEWKCSTPCLVGVDVDGNFMPCFDYNKKFTANNLKELIVNRQSAAEKCDGCIWTCAIISEMVVKGEAKLGEIV